MTIQNNKRPPQNKRRHARRTKDSCIGLIDGKTCPVRDWSRGGVLLATDGRLFALNDRLSFTLKFRLQDKILDIMHTGRVIRKAKDKIAVQFEPLTQDIHDLFQQVINDRAGQSA